MPDAVAHGEYEYRMQGGEVQRRPADREGLTPWEASWLVLSDKRDVPALVVSNLQQSVQPMRFD